MYETIMEISGVSKSFSGVTVLNKINMCIKKGEIHVIVGENGAGKSTLMKIISGVYQKDEGVIVFEGETLEIKGSKGAIEKGISIIHQELNLLPHRTIGQNIFLGREPMTSGFIKLIDQNEIYVKSKALLEYLGLDIDPRTKVSSLGIAQQQMVEVAKALCFSSKILIMDEPTATLTKKETTRLFEVIQKLKSEGVSILYISHRLEELKKIADTYTVLRDGNLVATLPAEEADTEKIIRLMVGRDVMNQYSQRNIKFGEEVLRTEGLCSYRFQDVNIHLSRGEVVGIYGLVGAGRTELAKAIFGDQFIEKGTVTLFGTKYKKISPRKTVKLKIGFIPEDRKEEGIILEKPVKNNITQAALGNIFKNKILNYSTEKKIAEQYVDRLNIKTTNIMKLVKLLSGGNQQKVVIAKWVCANCEMIIFDEPTRGIDVGAKAEIYKIMNTMVTEGKAILMISSDMPEILGLCDRIYVMKDGKISGEFSKSEATQENILACCI